MYTNFYDKKKIVQYFNTRFSGHLTYSRLNAIMSKFHVKALRRYQRRNISDEERKEIVRRYNAGESTTKLAKIFGYKTPKSINDILKEEHQKMRSCRDYCKYKDLNFSKINSKEKAYFLGLLLTDGYNSKTYIGLQLVDKDCIYFLRDTFQLPCIKIKKKDQRCKSMYRITLHGKDRIKQLETLGIKPNKSLTLKGPDFSKIDEDSLPYVIRGIIDGDGWIRKDGKEFFICSASNNFIDWCIEALNRIGIHNMNKIHVDNEYNGIYYVRTAKKENINILKNVVYDKPFGMARKYNRLHPIKN